MRDVVIIGAGGFGREVAWLIEDINKVEHTWNIIGFLDDNQVGKVLDRYKILGTVSDYKNFDCYFVIAIANGDIRFKIEDSMLDVAMERFPNIIHPSVIFSNDFEMGCGNIIHCQSVVSTEVVLGNFCVIDSLNYIGHDVVINDYVTIFPSCNISGFVNLESYVQVGVGSKILQNISVGRNSIIGAGSVVTRSFAKKVMAYGVPCKKIKDL